MQMRKSRSRPLPEHRNSVGDSTSLRLPFAFFRLNEYFYEKVIKVKADVAALLNLFSDVSIDVRW